MEINGANSGGVREEDEEEDHHQSDLPTCGLLRIEDKLRLLAAEAVAASACTFPIAKKVAIPSSRNAIHSLNFGRDMGGGWASAVNWWGTVFFFS